MTRLSFNWKVRKDLYHHLSVQLANESPLISAMESYQKRLARRKKTKAAQILNDINRRLKNGKSLADSMTKWAPQDEIMVLASGEMSGAGKLSESIDMLLAAKERMQRVKQAIKGAFTSSIVYVIMIYSFLYIIGAYVVPPLSSALPANRVQGSAALLYKLGDFFTSWWSVVPPILIVILALAAVKSLPGWTGLYRTKAEAFFPYSFYRDMEGYKWLQGFASLLQSGMPDTKILTRQSETATPWLKERLHAIQAAMENGSSLSKSLTDAGFDFPSRDMIDDIESMEGFPDFAARISKLSSDWAVEIELGVTNKSKALGGFVEVFMMALMAFLYIASQSLSSQLGSSTGL